MPHTLLNKILCASAALGLSAVFTPPALAHDPRYPQYNDFLNSLYFPYNGGNGQLTSCCNAEDCRALKFGTEGEPGVEAWYDTRRKAYAFVASSTAWSDPMNTGDDQVYHLTQEETRAVQQKVKDGHFVKPENPTDNLAFACWTRAMRRAWCMVPPEALY